MGEWRMRMGARKRESKQRRLLVQRRKRPSVNHVRPEHLCRHMASIRIRRHGFVTRHNLAKQILGVDRVLHPDHRKLNSMGGSVSDSRTSEQLARAHCALFRGRRPAGIRVPPIKAGELLDAIVAHAVNPATVRGERPAERELPPFVPARRAFALNPR